MPPCPVQLVHLRPGELDYLQLLQSKRQKTQFRVLPGFLQAQAHGPE